MDALKKYVVPGVIAALLVAFAVTLFDGDERKTVTLHFPRAISVYEGSDVRVLGVGVGTVTRVEPTGTDVTVIARTGWTTNELWQAIQQKPPQGTYELVSLLIGVNDEYRGGAANSRRQA